MSSKKVDSLENKISKLEIDVEKSTAALKLAKEKLDTTKKELRYRKLRSFATNPKTLQLALEENREIWELSTIFVDELNKADCGFRFASNEKERVILDILTGVLNGNKKLSNL